MSHPFRHSAGFGKRIEYWIVGLMLKQGMDVYLPLVDDDAIEAQLAHADQNNVRRTYNHATYFDERRAMMQDWADRLDEWRAQAQA